MADPPRQRPVAWKQEEDRAQEWDLERGPTMSGPVTPGLGAGRLLQHGRMKCPSSNTACMLTDNGRLTAYRQVAVAMVVVAFSRDIMRNFPPERHHLFDGLRGVAALAVCAYHIGNYAGVQLVAAGYLAVDFFFLLSGFVIAHAYQRRLEDGCGVAVFARRRIARLYPAYAAGMVLGVSVFLILKFSFGETHSVAAKMLAIALNMILLPAPPSFVALYPTNFVAWSLASEMLVNLFYAAFMFSWSRAWLGSFVTVAAAATLAAGLSHGRFDGGCFWNDGDLGLLRAAFAFPLGVLIARLRPATASPSARAWAAVAGLAVALVMPVSAAWRLPMDLAVVGIGFPLLLWTAAGAELPQRGRAGLEWLGRLSYPLYAVHAPLLIVVPILTILKAPPIMTFAATLSLALLVADFVSRRFEPAGRRWLAARLPGACRDPLDLGAAPDPVQALDARR